MDIIRGIWLVFDKSFTCLQFAREICSSLLSLEEDRSSFTIDMLTLVLDSLTIEGKVMCLLRYMWCILILEVLLFKSDACHHCCLFMNYDEGCRALCCRVMLCKYNLGVSEFTLWLCWISNHTDYTMYMQ